MYVFIIPYNLASYLKFTRVDAIVCLDACFTQKRKRTKGNQAPFPREHPETVFLPEEEAAAMETLVESVRPSKPRKNNQSTSAKLPYDGYEPGMRVPTSVLDGCNESFTAADDNRVKASTQFFSDTGLMAMLCRHDRVLWLVNMKSAGEKQFYALALLDKLFSNVPKSMRLGCLYDIGCQLHRSCVNLGFLEEYLDRLIFGISVFHAYGHQWPCQVVYHPRKCEGFGQTDGEGCERFWSAIKPLIPSLRSSGYFTRIYALDTQVKHLDGKSCLGLGKWLRKKWISAETKEQSALEILQDIYATGITETKLRTEWQNQVAEQTKPMARQSKHLADKQIHDILALTRTLDEVKSETDKYDAMLTEGTSDDELSIEDIQEHLEALGKKKSKIQKTITNQKKKLTVDGRLNLTKLLGNEFLRLRMNALALKQRIRDKLRNRKFELEAIERAYRVTVNKAKLDKNAHQQMKRKEPGINSLAQKYNKSCNVLQTMVAEKKAPRGARAPVMIELEGLYKLDVDDDIWQDIGLTDESDYATVPDWLGNDLVQKGIKALLEYDRCLEEKRRIIHECISMQDWMVEEWDVCVAGLGHVKDDPNLTFILQERKQHLLRLCAYWVPAIDVIPSGLSTEWGPSAQDIMHAAALESTESTVGQDNDDDDDYDDLLEDVDDAAVFADVEASRLADAYHYVLEAND